MSNKIGIVDEVTSEADGLMKELLAQARASDDLDFRVQAMQTATRYLAVKQRMNIPDEANFFDEWRSGSDAAAGGAAVASPAAAGPSSAGNPQRADRARPPKGKHAETARTPGGERRARTRRDSTAHVNGTVRPRPAEH